MNTAELIVSMLEQLGVQYIFGVPGGAIEDINTALYESTIQPIVTKHEEGAAFMADGYARVSGQVGICCSTAGPGASNLITGLATAYADSTPVFALTGQVSTSVFGKGAIQESGSEGVNIVSIFRHFTKYSGMVINERRAGFMVDKAFRLALSKPPGPVHLNLPTDVMKRPVPDQARTVLPTESRLFDRDGVNVAAEKLVNAKRPVIIAGWGVVLSRGAEPLLQLAELLDIPVATSPKAKGVFPESHPLSLGCFGFAGSPVARSYIIEGDVDVLLAVGTSFNEMMTGGWDERLHPSQELIQIDINGEQIGKNYAAGVGLVGDAEAVLKEICFAVKRQLNVGFDEAAQPQARLGLRLRPLKEKHAVSVSDVPPKNGLYDPQALVMDLQRSLPESTIYFADIGTSMAWAIRYLVIDRPYSFYVALGFGTMGYAVAAPVGAKLAAPDRPVVALVGDGSFLMNGFEVATAVNHKVPVIWVVFNNSMLGMVYHGRKLFKKPIPEGIPSRFERVDFAKVAEGLQARGLRIESHGQITPELMNDILKEGRPTILDVWIDEERVPPIHSRIQTVDKHYGG